MPISKIIYKASAQDTGTVWMDATPATAAAADITAPKTAMLANGVLTTGTGSGGGSMVVEEKDVNFIDYDGTIVASYTAADFASLSALPANPSHSGLTAQGWNWSLSDAKTYVASYGKLWIGQMYTASDGKTRIYIHISDDTPPAKRKMTIRFTQSVAYGVSVDWGDGSTAQTYSGTSASSHDHTYDNTGDYVITLDVVSGTVSFIGSTSYTIYGNSSSAYTTFRSRIYKVEIGAKVASIGDYAFRYCNDLESITIPSSVEIIGTNVFYECSILKSITIPTSTSSINTGTFNTCYGLKNAALPLSVTNIANSAFANCRDLASITIPSDVTNIGESAFNQCYNLMFIVIPTNVTSIGKNALQYCYNLKSLTIPSSVLSVGDSAFGYCYNLSSVIIGHGITALGTNAFIRCQLTSIVIPSSVTDIGGSAFASLYAMNEYHFLATTPPTIGTSIFNSIQSGTIIYVPYSADHSILEAYQTATNWSTYADYMQEEAA